MDDTGEVVGETNFVISEAFLLSHWKECPICGQEENVEDLSLRSCEKIWQPHRRHWKKFIQKRGKNMRRTLLFKNIYEFAESIEFMIEIEGTAPLNEIFIQMSKSAIRKAKEIPGWTKDDLVNAACEYFETLGYTCNYSGG